VFLKTLFDIKRSFLNEYGGAKKPITQQQQLPDKQLKNNQIRGGST